MIVHNLRCTNLNERWQTISRLDGDVIVLPLEEPTPFFLNRHRVPDCLHHKEQK